MRQLAFLYIMLASAFGQTGDIRPTFTNKQFVYSYPGSFSSIRKIDFRNFAFVLFDDNGNPTPWIGNRSKFHLKNGHYKQWGTNIRYASIDLDSIHYLPQFPTSDGDSALVLLSWFGAGGSSSQWGTADLLTLSGSHLQVVQEIEWQTHAGGNESFDPTTNTLVVRSDHHVGGDGNCCLSALDVGTFKWDGSRFVQTDTRTDLWEYSDREGKTLPRLPAR